MTFDPNIPQPGDFLSDSQQDILNNFISSNTSMGINHYPFNDLTLNNGKHKFLQMPEIPNATVLAIPATTVNEAALYTKVGTNPAETNLFYRAENSSGGGGFEYQMTHANSNVLATARFGNNTNYQVGPPSISGGWTFLPGGLILQYGKLTFVSQNGTVTFPIPFNFNPFMVQVSLERSSGNQTVTIGDAPAPTTTGFNYLSSSSGSAFLHWMAIGL